MIESLLTYSPIAILIFIIIYMILNPEKVETWHGLLSRCFAGISERAEKSAVSKEIQGRINHVSKKMNKETEGIIPYGLKIDWVKEKDRDVFIKENTVIIKMKNHHNQSENFAYATLAYLSQGCLPNARPYIEDNILNSIDFTVAKSIFLKEKQHDALRFFNAEIFKKAIKKNPLISEYSDIMEKLNNRGLFTRLLLKEFLLLGDTLSQQIPSQQMKDETKIFVDILNELITKEKDEDINPCLYGEYIKSSIVLVARYDKFINQGTEPYLYWIDKCTKKGIDTFFLLAAGKNITPAYMVTKELENDERFEKIYENEYNLPIKKGKSTKAVIIIVKTKVQ